MKLVRVKLTINEVLNQELRDMCAEAHALYPYFNPTEAEAKMYKGLQDIVNYIIKPLAGSELCYISEPYPDEHSDAKKDEALEEMSAKMASYFISTSDYYGKLLDLYEAKSDKLMDEIKSKFGVADMPQTATFDEFQEAQSNDLTRVRVQATEGDTAMARLDEVQKLYRAVKDEWARDFINRFVVYE